MQYVSVVTVKFHVNSAISPCKSVRYEIVKLSTQYADNNMITEILIDRRLAGKIRKLKSNFSIHFSSNVAALLSIRYDLLLAHSTDNLIVNSRDNLIRSVCYMQRSN